MSWSSYHTESEKLAIAAELSARNRDATRASELYRLAADSEARALAELKPDKQRSLGITVVSAVALYYKGGAYETAENLAQQWISKPSLPTFAVHQLEEILNAIRPVNGADADVPRSTIGLGSVPRLPARILLVDSDADYLWDQKQFLEKAGYLVITAATVPEAQRILQFGLVSLAILHVRLNDDNDPNDLSGLFLAKESSLSIPKIVLTRYTSIDSVRQILADSGRQSIVDVVDKEVEPEALLKAVRRRLDIVDFPYSLTSDQITQQLYEDYQLARRQAKAQYFVSLSVSVASTLTILVGVCFLLLGNLQIGIVCAISGLVVGVIGQFLFTRLDNSRHRLDTYHEEMLHIKWLEDLVMVCNQISDEETRQTYIARLIQATIQGSRGPS